MIFMFPFYELVWTICNYIFRICPLITIFLNYPFWLRSCNPHTCDCREVTCRCGKCKLNGIIIKCLYSYIICRALSCIECLCPFNDVKYICIIRCSFWIKCPLYTIFYIMCCYRVTICPLYILSHMECPDKTIIRYFPFCSKRRDYFHGLIIKICKP